MLINIIHINHGIYVAVEARRVYFLERAICIISTPSYLDNNIRGYITMFNMLVGRVPHVERRMLVKANIVNANICQNQFNCFQLNRLQ